MYRREEFIGCACDSVEDLKARNLQLNAQVVERVNKTQEMVLMNGLSVESDEFQFKKCLQERISELSSWHWVLNDLKGRVVEAVASIQYELKALRVVVQRIDDEVANFSQEGSRPGALTPYNDIVEEAIFNEHEFLKKQRVRFEKMIPDVEKQIRNLEKVIKRIEQDMINKEQAIKVEKECAKINAVGTQKIGIRSKTKKKPAPVTNWEHRCQLLKKNGLRALSSAIVTKHQLRGARSELSVLAQAHAARVDAALRRRHHANLAKIQELAWQRDEAVRDFHTLEDEMEATEKSILEHKEQERLVAARIADRRRKPARELTRDEVDRKLRDELAKLKQFNKDLNNNIDRINYLQGQLKKVIFEIDNHGEDLMHVLKIDEQRIRHRRGDSLDTERPGGLLTCDQNLMQPSTSPGPQHPSVPLEPGAFLPRKLICHSEEGNDANKYELSMSSLTLVDPLSPTLKSVGDQQLDPSELKTIVEEDEDDVDDYPFPE